MTGLFASLPQAVREALLARGVAPAHLDGLLPDAGGAGVLLGGSYAEGAATASSDLDLLVLFEAGEGGAELVRRLPAVHHRSMVFDELMVELEGGLEVNLQLAQREHLRRLEGMMREAGRALGRRSRGRLELPLLQTFDIVFVERLRAGLVLRGTERAEAWRRRFRVDVLPDYMVASQVVAALSYLEDAFSLAHTGDARAPAAARIAAEAVVIAALACVGTVAIDAKGALGRAIRLRRTGRDLPAALHDAERLLFPSLSEAAGDAYQRALIVHLADIRTRLRGAGSTTVVELLDAYAGGDWRPRRLSLR